MWHDAGILFLILMGFHFIADYPLQGDFLSKAKNPWNRIPGIPWHHAMMAHCGIHALFVGLITGSLLLAVLELILHFIIDTVKCASKISFTTDQNFHTFCKLFWAYIAVVVWHHQLQFLGFKWQTIGTYVGQ